MLSWCRTRWGSLFPQSDPWRRIRLRDAYRETHRVHVASAHAMSAELERLWQRPLTANERAVVASSTLCCSGMMLEAIERGLMHKTTAAEAEQEFAHLEAEVGRQRAQILQRLADDARVEPLVLTRDAG